MKGVMRRWLGASGALFGTSGRARLTFFYSFATVAVLVGVINTINVITIQHGEPSHSFVGPAIGEGSSWLSLLLFLWIPWIAWRVAPPGVRPRWKLLLHVPAALSFRNRPCRRFRSSAGFGLPAHGRAVRSRRLRAAIAL